MKPRIRLHVRLVPPSPAQTHWTFDAPTRVTAGFSTGASMTVLDPALGPQKELFFRQGGNIYLRVHEEMKGEMVLKGEKISLTSLRESGILAHDRSGPRILLKGKTSGAATLGATTFHFWLQEAPDEPEFPLHPLPILWARTIPKLFLFLFLLSATVHVSLVWKIRRLPGLPEPTLSEVDREFRRLRIDMLTILEEPHPRATPTSTETKQEKSTTARSEGGAPPSTKEGPLPAARSRRPSGPSPFAALFGASKDSELDQLMAAGGGAATPVDLNLRTGVALPTSRSEAPSDIGSLRRNVASGPLAKEVRSPSVVTLSSDGPDVQGALDPVKLQSSVQNHAGELRDCYERALVRDPELTGKIVVGLVITLDGAASQVMIAESTIQDRLFERCLISRVAAWTFPRPEIAATPVKFPFVFSPGSRG